MIVKSTIEFTKFYHTLITNIVNFFVIIIFGNSFTVFESTSHSHHNFTMFLFNFKIWMNEWQKLRKRLTSNLSIMNFFLKFSFSISGFPLMVISAFKRFSNPSHNSGIGITNFDVGMIIRMFISSGRFGLKHSYKKTTFTIYE